VDDLVAHLRRLKPQQVIGELPQPVGTFRGHDAPLLLRPVSLDLVPRVLTQIALESAADWLRIAAQIAIQSAETRGFLGDEVAHCAEVLVGGHGDEADQDAVEHGITRKHETHHLVGAPVPVEPRVQKATQREGSRPGHNNKNNSE
jgi:hypothetical protein